MREPYLIYFTFESPRTIKKNATLLNAKCEGWKTMTGKQKSFR